MITRNLLRAIATATTCLAPLAAFAQSPTPAPAPAASSIPFTGELGFGLMGVEGNNQNQAGRYSGLNTTGANAVGQFDVRGASPWDSGGTRYYSFTGDNLVFQSGDKLGTGLGANNTWGSSVNNQLVNNGEVSARAGDQGTWGAGAYYDAITYTGNVIDSLYTVTRNGYGYLNNGLAPWGGATASKAGSVTSFTIPTLSATGAMQPVQTGTRRDIVGADFKYIMGDWTFTGAFRHEHKEGSMEESFDGPYGGTAFALPIDYDTDRYDLSAAYYTRMWQGVFQYTYSHFSDNNNFVNLPYPMSNTAAPFQRSAAYSTPPSNDAHYFTFLGATNVVPLTRINVNARVGIEKQDDDFAPNTADPNPPASALGVGLLDPKLQGTTANSLNASATIYQVKVTAASNPLPNFDTRVFYGIDGRSVSLNQYRVNVGGTGGSSDSTLTGLAYVVPQDWLKQNAGFEAGYRILPQYDTKLTVGYRLDAIDRSNAQVGHSWTDTGSVALSSAFGPQINGRLSFDYSNRSGNLSYLTPWENLLVAPGGTQTTPTYSGAYYQAPMTSEGVTARASYMPMDNLSADMFVRFRNENYTYPGATVVGSGTASALPITGSGTGIKQDYTLTIGPDVDWRPRKDLNIHFFYTFERLFYNNQGNGACNTVAQAATAACLGTAGYFQNKDTSNTHTIGVSGEWKVNEKLKLRADYTISYGTVMFGEFNGVFVPTPTASYQNVANYPDVDSLMHNLKLTVTYELVPNVTLVGQGIYTSFHNNDWYDTANAIQGAGTTSISLLTPGYASPNYSVFALMGGVKVRF
jgi:MtrB/PioB family decaheme-associated outer membrane protein